MEITRRDWQLLSERVGRIESKLYQLDSRITNIENFLKPENLLRRVRQAEAEEKIRAEKEDIFKSGS